MVEIAQPPLGESAGVEFIAENDSGASLRIKKSKVN
jgi:hypothetical protein